MLAASVLQVSAQPPNVSRWNGLTANTQSQGFANGDPLKLTLGFAALGTSINDSTSTAPNNLQTSPGCDLWQSSDLAPLFQSAFDRWSAVSGMSFQLESADDGAAYFRCGETRQLWGVLGTRADIRIGGKNIDGNAGVLAYNFFPEVGDMVIDTNDNFFDNTASSSSILRFVLAHELGHALGFDHVVSSDQAFLMEPFLQTGFDGPAYHDILTAQNGYGDALEKSNNGLGNDSVANATNLGTLVIGGNLSIGNDARNFLTNASTTDFISIDNNTDTDFFSFNVSSAGLVNITLDSLGFTYGAGPENQLPLQVNFDTKQRSDLRFSLFGSDGVSLLASVNSFGLGLAESLTGFNLSSPGTYYLRVQGSGNVDASTLDTQFYGLNIGLITAVPEPSSLALLTVLGTAVVGRRALRKRKST